MKFFAAAFIGFLLICLGLYFMLDMRTVLLERKQKKREAQVRKEKVYGQKKRKIGAFLAHRRALLELTGVSKAFYYVLSVGCIIGGFAVGKLMFQTNLLAAALACAGIVIPGVYLEIQSRKMRIYNMERLENSMSVITNAYMSSEDIIQAVKENVGILSYRKPFEEFLLDVTYVDNNIDRALLRMADKVQNQFLSLWVDALIMSQADRKMMYILPSIIDQMNDVRQDQMEADTAMVLVWRDYIMMVVLVCAIPLVFRFVLYEWYAILVFSFVGRVFMILLIAALLYSLKRAIEINEPIES